jgi:hypothetical protein
VRDERNKKERRIYMKVERERERKKEDNEKGRRKKMN